LIKYNEVFEWQTFYNDKPFPYPVSGKGNNWTALALNAITAEWKGDSIADGGGLTGEVIIIYGIFCA
jgi:hypothetical protein